MKLEEFKAGVEKQQYQYKSFSPAFVNQTWTWDDPHINTMLEKANVALAQLNAYSDIVPNIDVFISMHITKEAQTSSKIEGTQTEMSEVLMEVEHINPEKRDDWQEVKNYIQAINYAVKELKTFPLSNRLLKQTHEILMTGVRGEGKAPGEFRQSQNWIGGVSLKDAVFIPPHHEEMPELLADLEKFWHNEQIEVPQLIRIAISHYQFETIHPFLDGNGRIGRLLITLFLINSGLLSRPSLYLSAYLEKQRGHYYDALTRVRTSNDLVHWIKFFLLAVTDTAQKGMETFQNILDLKQYVDEKIVSLGKRAENANKLVQLLYGRPLVDSVSDVAGKLGITNATANKLINALAEIGLLKEITGYSRNRIFVFQEYLSLFQDR